MVEAIMPSHRNQGTLGDINDAGLPEEEGVYGPAREVHPTFLFGETVVKITSVSSLTFYDSIWYVKRESRGHLPHLVYVLKARKYQHDYVTSIKSLEAKLKQVELIYRTI